MLPIRPQPKHLLTAEESASVIATYQQADWHTALSQIIRLTNVNANRALKELSTLVGLGGQTKTAIRNDPRWAELQQSRQTPIWHSFVVLAVLVVVAIAGGLLLPFDTFYRLLVPALATLLIIRWGWLTHRGQAHARVVIGGILLVVLSGLVAAALMDEQSNQVPAAALPLILWCLVALGGGLAFSVWGAVAPMGADKPDEVVAARLGWRIGLVNLAATVLLSSLVMYLIGLVGGQSSEEPFNTLFRFMIFMIVYAAFSAYLLAPLATSALQATLALALPAAIGVLKWVNGSDGEAFGYLLLLSAIQIATVGLTSLGLLMIAFVNRLKEGQEGQLVAAAIAVGVAAIGWTILRFLVGHGTVIGAFTNNELSTWLWIGVPAALTAAFATGAAYQASREAKGI